MRKIPAASAIIALAVVGLTGCSLPGTGAGCERPAVSGAETMELISVSGSTDAAARVDTYTPLRFEATAYEDVETGEGVALTSDDQLGVIDVTLVNGSTGETIVSTPYDGDLTRVLSMSQWLQSFPGFETALDCATEGSRVAIALAPGDVEAETAASLGLAEDDAAIAVVDIRKLYLPKADGALQFNSGLGLPAVVRAPDGRPGVIMPEADAPDELVIQTLKKGDGDVVDGSAPVRAHYTGVTWADRAVFDTSWDGEPASFELDGVVPGFAAALEGQTVGSQVMVVVPPELGYGDQEQGSIPAGSTLVFVIDILGIDEPAA
ncbi:FKBP-type peptidyl-prolyl cis-trans isomerase [Microbacterium hominis]|uniref:Peptidyl-prolyl cis-trans isomerase n=1 Tax=Microbacterium hominis TaxID=162426 RepID=A0A7D4PMH2_9MICO|nr:FKBP-type peptidyl-prolyl cis-trans isomerase [Microbacterium hominis]QKJ19550.1 FKBP-type peptidyl-prolyl cis-trans isomerase [Microbacterium hominis]